MFLNKKEFKKTFIISIIVAPVLLVLSIVMMGVVMRYFDSGEELSFLANLSYHVGLAISSYLMWPAFLLPSSLNNSILPDVLSYVSTFIMVWIPVVLIYLYIQKKDSQKK